MKTRITITVMAWTLDISSAMVENHTSYLVRVEDFLLINALKQQTYKSISNTNNLNYWLHLD